MTTWQAYLLTRMDYIQFGFIILCVFYFLRFVGLWIICIDVFADDRPIYVRRIRWASVLFLIPFIGFVLTPDTKETAFIYLAPKITNSELIKEIPEDMMELKDLAMEYIHRSVSGNK